MKAEKAKTHTIFVGATLVVSDKTLTLEYFPFGKNSTLYCRGAPMCAPANETD